MKRNYHSEPIKIMHLQPSLEFGGMENGIVNLSNGLVSAGFDVHILNINEIGSLAQRLRKEINIQCLNINDGKKPWLPFQIAKYLRKEGIHLLHAHEFYSNLYGLIAAKVAGTKVTIVGEHALPSCDGQTESIVINRKTIRKALYRGTDAIVAVAYDIKRQLAEEFDLSEDKLFCLPNGVDSDRFFSKDPRIKKEMRTRFGIGENEFIVGHVGRLVPVKNQRMLIEAVCRLAISGEKICLVITGDGPLLNELTGIAEAYGLSDRVRFLGLRDDVEDIYQVFDVFALTSDSEGMSNVILEAMSCGLPVIATDIGANSTLVEHEKNGLIVKKGDLARLCDAISFLKRDRGKLMEMGEVSRKRILDYYSIVKMAENYRYLYLSLLRSKGVGQCAA